MLSELQNSHLLDQVLSGDFYTTEDVLSRLVGDEDVFPPQQFQQLLLEEFRHDLD